MIKLECDNCGQVINLKDEMAGRKGRCPRCGSSMIIPGGSRASAASDLLAEESVPNEILPPSECVAAQKAVDANVRNGEANLLSAEPASEPSCLHPAAIAVIVVAILVVGGVLTWTFAFRDTWQRDNYSAIIAIESDANTLSAKPVLFTSSMISFVAQPRSVA